MSFKRDIERASKRIGEHVETVGRNVVVTLFNSIVRDTPVDTGLLQGGWIVTLDSPGSGRPGRRGPGGPQSEIAAKVKKPASYWLTNNYPHAPVAEYGRWGTGEYATEKTTRDGFSIQAPEGMVRKNIIRVRTNLRRLGVK